MVCLSCGYLSKGIHFLCSYFRIGGASIIAHTAHQINEEIHDKEVRLISAQGEQLGIMPLAEAMAKAGDADLDLVKISPNAVPPVCKLMNYGKFRNAQRFLADGNRVKVAVRFRGREMAHTDIGKRLLEKFAADCAEVATMDKEPKLDGRHMTMFLSCRQNKETKK